MDPRKCKNVVNNKLRRGEEEMIIKGIEEGEDIQPVIHYGVVGDNGCGVFSDLEKKAVASGFIVNMRQQGFESYEEARIWAESQTKLNNIRIYRENWFYHLNKYGAVKK